MQLTKKQMLIGAGVVATLGVYLIVRYYIGKKNNQEYQPQPIGGNTTSGNAQVGSQTQIVDFPIKLNSRDKGAPLKPQGKVVDIQKLINTIGYKPKGNVGVTLKIKLVEDGIYGPKTSWAVEQYIGKKTIDNEQDLENLTTKIAEAKAKSGILSNPDDLVFKAK